jgi:hypothetical protein
VRSLILRILNNWGDHEFVGLTEVEVLDRSSQPIKFRCSSSALQNGQRLMTRPESMWQAAFRRGLEIRCVFERETEVAKLRIWNFNAPRELEKGVSLMAVVTG